MKQLKLSIIFFISVLLIVTGWSVKAEKSVNLKIQKITANLYCLSQAGGNMAILIGNKQLLLVDAGHARLANEVAEKLYQISPFPVKMLINTHYHGDHTGGNPILGEDAIIMAHRKCRNSMVSKLQPEESAEGIGAPSQTYKQEKEIKWGEEKVTLRHFGPGHTSGDTVVIFSLAKTIHTGDLFFNGIAPYIDVKDGSDTGNWVKTIRSLAKEYPHHTVIPGHGPVTDMKEFLKFADYLDYLRTEVKKAISTGKTRQETINSVDVTDFKHLIEYGDFMTRKNNIGWIYDELTGHNNNSM